MKSIVVEVRKAVIAGLAVALGDDSVSVTYGWQGSDETAVREQVFTNNARGTHEPTALKAGRNFRREEMSFDVTVLILAVGEKPEEAEERALEIGEVVEEFIADHKNNELGVDGLIWIQVTEFALNYRIAPGKGSIAEATYTVTYTARLT